ncbi:MAG: hypothetical protein NTW25_00480, partial [Candidatus Kapabacteria bacterium]|nr:hypothetical protein [Candidatus Kapabacteria bacterium]
FFFFFKMENLEKEIKEKAEELLELLKQSADEGKKEFTFVKEFEDGNARMIMKYYKKDVKI